ncbi:hypothetical protein R0135_12980 [Congregibacter variabilis]|uniref:SoxXA-binding protein SoxK n=1 Tax=Congregibacter variabilis TaxID=3081200 RepID=A0ABZ0I1N6_9GAMM|nr:hypothetical protein R0135_12980 [Congregibacter sp. IMCC43200]
MMKTVIKKSLLLSLSLSAAAAFAGPAETLERASAIYEQALAQEHGWSVTQPLIDEAREAMAAGDEDRAQALADRALLTAEQSLKQARDEKNAWQARVVGR